MRDSCSLSGLSGCVSRRGFGDAGRCLSLCHGCHTRQGHSLCTRGGRHTAWARTCRSTRCQTGHTFREGAGTSEGSGENPGGRELKSQRDCIRSAHFNKCDFVLAAPAQVTPASAKSAQDAVPTQTKFQASSEHPAGGRDSSADPIQTVHHMLRFSERSSSHLVSLRRARQVSAGAMPRRPTPWRQASSWAPGVDSRTDHQTEGNALSRRDAGSKRLCPLPKASPHAMFRSPGGRFSTA